jgi:hypothetical protein
MTAPAERRALVRVFGSDKRSRSTVIAELLAVTDDGYVIHLPTGRHIPPPLDAEGLPREDIKDDRAFVLHMLAADQEAWETTRGLEFGGFPATPLRDRLLASSQSYAGA